MWCGLDRVGALGIYTQLLYHNSCTCRLSPSGVPQPFTSSQSRETQPMLSLAPQPLLEKLQCNFALLHTARYKQSSAPWVGAAYGRRSFAVLIYSHCACLLPSSDLLKMLSGSRHQLSLA